MPIAPTYPGVYIQELPSQFRAITGVATSVAAFIDWFPRGPLNEAIQVNSWADVERTFGGLHTRSEASYALDQFFANGGSTAWVVRVSNAGPAPNVADAAATLGMRRLNTGNAAAVLTLTAREPGAWGNSIRAIIEPGSTATSFNLVLREVNIAEGRQTVLREERYNELETTPTDPNFVTAALNNHGAMATTVGTVGAAVPSPSGTINTVALTHTVVTGLTAHEMTVDLIVSSGPADVRDIDLGAAAYASIDDLAARLQGALQGAIPTLPGFDPARVEFAQAIVQVTVSGDGLQVLGGTGATFDVRWSFSGPLATQLGLTAAANDNVAAYQFGQTVSSRAQTIGAPGADGSLPRVQDLVGQEAVNPATGMYALNLADTVNLVCIPRISLFEPAAPDNMTPAQFDAAVAAFTLYCQRRRAMLLLDAPDSQRSPTDIKSFMTIHAGVRDPNVALFYPRLTIGDPLRDYLDRSIGASGAIAGICARTDANRGVWKAPAGTEALVRGITRLETKLTDAENGILNPVGINCLRTFDLYGHVNWGGRTLVGVDSAPNQWKYIPVRRLALFLEETLYRSTLWVIHEPNDEPLWAQIRLSVGAFMNDLFQKGALQGRTKQEAYFVHCDSTTTTPLDQERGIVNLTVGFAPLKPAEFLIISIQQIPPQVEV